jgi:hypothetical protein
MNDTLVLLIWWVIIAVWLLFLLIWMRKWLLKKRNYDLETEVTDLMYEQHKRLFLLYWKLFDQKKVEESYFFAKRKFLLWEPTKNNQLLFLQKWKEDMQFLSWLTKIA